MSKDLVDYIDELSDETLSENTNQVRDNINSGNKTLSFYSVSKNELKTLAIRLGIGLFLLFFSKINLLGTVVPLIAGILSFAVCGISVISEAVEDCFHKNYFSSNVLTSFVGLISIAVGDITGGVLVVLLYQLGKLFVNLLSQKITPNNRTNYYTLSDPVKVINENITFDKPIYELEVGDVILVFPDEEIPVDGVVTNGDSFVDTSLLTGKEPLKPCAVGDHVCSGFKNISSPIYIQATNTNYNSSLAKSLRIIESAKSQKWEREQYINKCCSIFIVFLFALALLSSIFVPISTEMSFILWLKRMLVLIISASPWSFSAFVPLTVIIAIEVLHQKGIILKSPDMIDTAINLTSVVFAKTGVLTTGMYKIIATAPEVINDEQLLYLASYAEYYSNHPIALAIKKQASIDVDISRISYHKEMKGKGSSVLLDGTTHIYIGSAEFMDELGAKIITSPYKCTSAFVAVNKIYVGRIDLLDDIRTESANTVQKLRNLGIANIALMTGDNAIIASSVGKQIGISEIYSDCLPGDKTERMDYLQKTQENNEFLAYVVNSARGGQIVASDLSIALGGFSSNSESDLADILFVSDSPEKVPEFINFAKKIYKTIKDNSIITLAIKAILIVLAFTGIIHVWAAIIANIFAAVLCILNIKRQVLSEEIQS